MCQRVIATLVGRKEVQPLIAGIEAHLLHSGVFQRRITLQQRVGVDIGDAVAQTVIVGTDGLETIGYRSLHGSELSGPRQTGEELVLIARHIVGSIEMICIVEPHMLIAQTCTEVTQLLQVEVIGHEGSYIVLLHLRVGSWQGIIGDAGTVFACYKRELRTCL